MRIAFVSDIHSNLHAFEKVLEKIQSIGVDEIFCCGDIVGYNAFPKECLKVVREKGFHCVLGNHDWATLTGDVSWFNDFGVAGVNYSRDKIDGDDMDFLKGLQNNLVFEREGVCFYMVHGSPRDNIFEYVFPWSNDYLFEDLAKMVDADFILLGHTHVPMEKKFSGKVFLNPGSVGQPRDNNSNASFMVFDTKNRTYSWYRVSYDVDAAAKSIKDVGLPSFLADRLYLGK